MTNDQRRQLAAWRATLPDHWKTAYDVHVGPTGEMTLVNRDPHRRRAARQKRMHP